MTQYRPDGVLTDDYKVSKPVLLFDFIKFFVIYFICFNLIALLHTYYTKSGYRNLLDVAEGIIVDVASIGLFLSLGTSVFITFYKHYWVKKLHIKKSTNSAKNEDEISNAFERNDTPTSPEDAEISQFRSNKSLALLSLEKRTESISTRNNLVLLLISLALVAASAIVIFAGNLTSWDVNSVGTTDRIQSELKDVEKRLAEISEASQLTTKLATSELKLENLEKVLGSSSNKNEIASTLRMLAAQVIGDRDRLAQIRGLSNGVPSDATGLKSAQDFYAGRQKALGDLLKQAWDKEISSDKTGIDYRFLAATTITRISVVLIIVFLVQILLGLYRYNAKLNTHYNSFKDVIRIWDGDPSKLKALMSSFGPPRVDFGREPKHPLEDIIKAMDQKMEAAKRDDKPQQATT